MIFFREECSYLFPSPKIGAFLCVYAKEKTPTKDAQYFPKS